MVFAGRHIPEKHVLALPPAIARAREDLPNLQARIFGDGPERPRLLEAIRVLELNGAVEAPGFVDEETVEGALRCALCLVLPSEREGYVPNVVYTCGAMRHNDQIILPYAVSDTFSKFATIKIAALMRSLEH